MNISQQAVILSAELDTNTQEENTLATSTLESVLQDIDIPFNTATGVYNGREEKAFVVIVQDQLEIDALKDFAFKNFKQESILLQDSNQEAHLIFNDGNTIQLGVLQRVEKEVAQQKENYTILNGEYYTTVKR